MKPEQKKPEQKADVIPTAEPPKVTEAEHESGSRTALALERENAAQELAVRDAEITKLREELANKEKTLQIATSGDGVSPDLIREMAWRMKAGLPERHARQAALTQLASDAARKSQSPGATPAAPKQGGGN